MVAASASACALAMAPVPTIAARSGVCSGMGLLGEVGADCGVGAVGAEAAAHAEGVGGRRRGDAGVGEAGVAARLECVEPTAGLLGRGERAGLPALAPLGGAGRDERDGALVQPGEPVGVEVSASRWPASTAPSTKSARKPSTARSRRASAAARRSSSGRSAAGRAAAARYRSGSASTSSGNVMTASPASGSPAFCITTRTSRSPPSLTTRWITPGLEPDERAGLERMLREARPVDGLQPPAAGDDDVRLGRHGVQVRRAAREPVGSPPAVHLEHADRGGAGERGPAHSAHDSPCSAGSAAAPTAARSAARAGSLAPSAITTP